MGGPAIAEQIEALDRAPLIIHKRRLYARLSALLVLLPFAGFVVGATVQVSLLMSVVSSASDPGEITVLALWALAPLLGGGLLLWSLLGREIVSVDRGELVLRREILGIGRSRRLAAEKIDDVSVRPWDLPEERESYWGVGVGRVRVLADGKRFSVGIALSNSEAQLLAERLRRWKARTAGAQVASQ